MDLPLDKLKLSPRATHRLNIGNIKTVGRVLLATDEQLLSIKHLGPKVLQEIREGARIFLQHYIDQNPNWQTKFERLPPENQQLANTSVTNIYADISREFRLHIEKILSGNSQSDCKFELTAKETDIIEVIQKAVEALGIELCKLAYDNPVSTKAMIQGFRSFISSQETIQTIRNLYSKIPETRRTKQLSPYIKLFNQFQICKNYDLSDYISACNTVNDIEDNIYFIAEQENQFIIKEFLEWLSFDVLELVKSILIETVGEGRNEQILARRAAGETLETIGEAYTLTRERVRQCEGQAIQAFSKYQQTLPLLLFISAELNGDTIITSDDIRTIIPATQILLYLLKKHPDSQFEYDNHFDCFYIPDVVDTDSVYDFVSGLPKFIDEFEFETHLNQTSQNNNIPRKFLELAFKKSYHRTGTIWHKGKINQSLMYSFIIDKYFPNGFRLYDSDETARFRKYVREVFGDIGGSDSDRALWGIIQRVCVLYDRGVYIHPSRISIPDDLVHQIEKYFIRSGRTSISFHELYDKFADELLMRANITNRYSLQGVLKVHLGEKYIFYRDGISTKEGYKITQEIEKYIRRNSPVSKEAVMAAFSGISEAMLTQNIARLPSVILIENSTYMYSKGLKLTVDDYKIKKLIHSQTDDYPVTASKLLEYLYITHPDFLIRNNIDSPNTLFGILQFMFSNEFSFSRPYISSLNTYSTSKCDIILSLLEGQERVSISYLTSLCEEHHLSYQSPSSMIRALQDCYLRVDEDTLVLISIISVNNEKLDEIKQLLSSAIGHKGYLAFRSIDNYIFYPELGIQWTPFLLRSLIEKYLLSDFEIINNPTIQDIAFDLVVDHRLEIGNYEDLIRTVIRAEHHRDPFKDQIGVVKWLVDEGLLTPRAFVIKDKLDSYNSSVIRIVDRHLPKFIIDGSLMYTDEYGKLVIR